MPHSHHSHSGQFCNHATGDLSSMLATAYKARFSSYCLTEHCPRGNSHLYPGEKEAGQDYKRQNEIYDAFVEEAVRLQKQYADAERKMQVLIGFEAEWIIKDESEMIVKDLLMKYEGVIDYFIGSVHFVKEVPIDFSREMYEQVRRLCGGKDEDLFVEYFMAQNDMLKTLQPKVVGHFDLIRLYADDKDADWTRMTKVWELIVQNLEIVKSYGGVLEINSSALRKGLKEPYPRGEIAMKWNDMGGLFVLSDDAHAVDHVGTHYPRVLEYIKRIGLDKIGLLDKSFKGVKVKTMGIEELEHHDHWTYVKNDNV